MPETETLAGTDAGASYRYATLRPIKFPFGGGLTIEDELNLWVAEDHQLVMNSIRGLVTVNIAATEAVDPHSFLPEAWLVAVVVQDSDKLAANADNNVNTPESLEEHITDQFDNPVQAILLTRLRTRQVWSWTNDGAAFVTYMRFQGSFNLSRQKLIQRVGKLPGLFSSTEHMTDEKLYRTHLCIASWNPEVYDVGGNIQTLRTCARVQMRYSERQYIGGLRGK